jgi:pyruvate formate lyase activating enzyme
MDEILRLPTFAMDRLRMSTDGHGVRTLIGAYGCPLRCKYCLNPHSWSDMVMPRLFTPEMLLDEVKIDSLYFQTTNGGLTFGGGEPLLYSHFIKEFAKICPDSWSLYVETSLYVPFENMYDVVHIFEHFIVDIKSMDSETYKVYTGGDLDVPLNNLKWLLSQIGPEHITVRVPIIYNYADATSQETSIQKLRDIGIKNIDAFRYKTV